MKTYLSFSNKERTTKIVSSEMEKIPSAPLFQRGGTGIVLGDIVQVRDEPTLVDSQVVFKLNAGDKVEILDRTETKESFSKIEGILLNGGYHWYKVKKDNNVGWGMFQKIVEVASLAKQSTFRRM